MGVARHGRVGRPVGRAGKGQPPLPAGSEAPGRRPRLGPPPALCPWEGSARFCLPDASRPSLSLSSLPFRLPMSARSSSPSSTCSSSSTSSSSGLATPSAPFARATSSLLAAADDPPPDKKRLRRSSPSAAGPCHQHHQPPPPTELLSAFDLLLSAASTMDTSYHALARTPSPPASARQVVAAAAAPPPGPSSAVLPPAQSAFPPAPSSVASSASSSSSSSTGDVKMAIDRVSLAGAGAEEGPPVRPEDLTSKGKKRKVRPSRPPARARARRRRATPRFSAGHPLLRSHGLTGRSLNFFPAAFLSLPASRKGLQVRPGG
jgi:hypothetical protein